jgi:hypothetical protein
MRKAFLRRIDLQRAGTSRRMSHRRLIPKARRKAAKRKDEAYHARGSTSCLMNLSIFSVASAILSIESATLS